MGIRSILVLAIFALAGCSVEQRRPADTASASTSTGASRDTTTAPAAPRDSSTPTPVTAWTVTPDGIGSIRVGMNLDELRRVAGDVTVPNAGAECSYVHPPAAPPGVLIMLARGQVARVDVDSGGVKSDEGIAVGDSAARVTAAYAGRVTTTPHKYVPGGQYLSAKPTSPQDSSRRIVFETENGRVTRFRSGRLPEVEWVERCG